MSDPAASIEPLWRSYSTVAEWIRTADQKAGILLALVTATSAAIIAFPLAEGRNLVGWQSVLAVTCLGSAFVCSWYCLLTLLPRLDTTNQQDASTARGALIRTGLVLALLIRSLRPSALLFGNPSNQPDTPVLPAEDALFFGSLSGADTGLIASVYTQLGDSPQALREALATQVLALSRIATIKHHYLRIASAWLLFAAVGVAALSMTVVLKAQFGRDGSADVVCAPNCIHSAPAPPEAAPAR